MCGPSCSWTIPPRGPVLENTLSLKPHRARACSVLERKNSDRKTRSLGSCPGALEHRRALSPHAAAAHRGLSPHTRPAGAEAHQGPEAPLPVARSLQRLSGHVLGVQIFYLVSPQTHMQACALDGTLLVALHVSLRFFRIEGSRPASDLHRARLLFPNNICSLHASRILVILTIFQSFPLLLYFLG